MKRKLLVSLVIFFSISSVSFSIEPDIFVQSTVNRASKLLSEDISKEEKIKKLWRKLTTIPKALLLNLIKIF